MDPDVLELIGRLCTRVGMLMEDTSVIAITAAAHQSDRIRSTLAELTTAANTIAALVGAALAIACAAD